MQQTRRGVLSVCSAALLGGCSNIDPRSSDVVWKTAFESEAIVKKPYVGREQVAIVDSYGALHLLNRSSGDPAESHRQRPWHSAGTPPIPVKEGYLTVTDQVTLTDRSGESLWSEPVPGDEFAVLNSRPIYTSDRVYVTTSGPSLYAIDTAKGSINDVGGLNIDGRWWRKNEDGTEAAIGTGTLKTVVVDLQSKEILWENDSGVAPYPCFWDDAVIHTAYEDNTLSLLCSNSSDTQRWRTDLPGTDIAYTARLKDRILAISRKGSTDQTVSFATIVDPASGEVLSNSRFETMINRSGSVQSGTAYLTARNGAVYSIGPDGDHRTVAQIGQKITSPPAVDGNHLAFGTLKGEVFLTAV